MSKQATPAKVEKVAFTGTIEGKTVKVVHLFRRRYAVEVGGKVAGYITSKDPMNAAGRVATTDKLADLKNRLH